MTEWRCRVCGTWKIKPKGSKAPTCGCCGQIMAPK